jgi:hypothetical protein
MPKPNFCCLHIDKHKSKTAVKNIGDHEILRSQKYMTGEERKNIDPARTKDNYELIDRGGLLISKLVERRIREGNKAAKREVRKDAIRALGVVCAASDGIIRSWEPEVQRRYFEGCLAWARKTWGAENVVSAVVHMDEKNPHIQMMVVPIAKVKWKDGTEVDALSAKQVFRGGQKVMEGWQTDFHKEVGVEFKLDRGLPAKETGAKHLNEKDYRAAKDYAKECAKLRAGYERLEVSSEDFDKKKTELRKLEPKKVKGGKAEELINDYVADLERASKLAKQVEVMRKDLTENYTANNRVDGMIRAQAAKMAADKVKEAEEKAAAARKQAQDADNRRQQAERSLDADRVNRVKLMKDVEAKRKEADEMYKKGQEYVESHKNMVGFFVEKYGQEEFEKFHLDFTKTYQYSRSM